MKGTTLQMCPECRRENRASARFCIYCRAPQRGLLPKGKILKGRYRIVDLLGCGGMGAVYLADDLALATKVAVKENLEQSAEGQQQFQTEAKILAHIRHPFLPRVQDYFVADNRQYLVMDYIRGPSLEEWVESKGPLAEGQAVGIFRQVMRAVQYLHSRQPPVIHRDIKPSNVKIDPSGRAFLVDFGIAKILHWSSQTQAGARAVTPGYSPPEQYGTGTTDQRSDIYSLGATLYFACTGHHPPEAIHRITGKVDKLIPPRRLNPQISPRLERVILKALRVLQDDRYQSVQQMLADLKVGKIPARTPVPQRVKPAPPVSKPSPSPVPIAPIGRRVVALLLDLLFIGSLMTIFSLFYLFWQFQADPFDLHPAGELQQARLGWIVAVVWSAYRVLGHSLLGATVGKKIVGVHVTSLHGRRPGLFSALIRESLLVLEMGFCLGIPSLIWTAKDPMGQAWHDIVSGTVVVRARKAGSL
ncbi:MAG: protein kinase [Armatimonadetes bacterium]|nr:protein kinase [Armatimonadota bacterium]MDW8121900.1 protein kinase [Armatimonadota bacterium]